MKVLICITVFVSVACAGIIHSHSEELLDGGLALEGSDLHLGESLELDAEYGAGSYGYDAGSIGGEEALLEGGEDLSLGDGLSEEHSIAELSLASSAGLGYAGGYAAGYEDWH